MTQRGKEGSRPREPAYTPAGSLWYTPEEARFQGEVHDYVQRVVAPEAEAIERENKYPRDLLRRLGRDGYMGGFYPKEFGGQGRGVALESIVAEEFSTVSAALDMCRIASTVLFGMPVYRFGTPEQRRKFVKPLLTAEKIGAIAITEPEAGSDTAGMKTRAEKKNGTYILNGKKRFITNGSQADHVLVFAITDPRAHPHQGMGAFVVEKGMKGFRAVKDFELMGMRGARVSQLEFTDVEVPVSNRIGGEKQGFQVLMDELDTERVCIASGAVGYARGAFEIAVRYSSERVQFDQPIRRFEGVSFRIAEMATQIEAARGLTLQAARLVDQGKPATKLAAMAKFFATEAAVEVTNGSLQVLGGIGYTKEYPVERYL
ncbi:MAG: acyl-CoA dehydrogenase family protein, partial [Euryarchaeota archaeon]|nr:acyl-CoA dehydrogenase family protein [Euryarchaeota archaeon]